MESAAALLALIPGIVNPAGLHYANGIKSNSPGSRRRPRTLGTARKMVVTPTGLNRKTMHDETLSGLTPWCRLDSQGALAPLATLGYLI